MAVAYSYTLMARKDLPLNSLKEVVAHAKANPRKLTYASAGAGSGQHVLAAALWHLAGVELVHVPYRGAQAAYQDLLGGRSTCSSTWRRRRRGQIDAAPSGAGGFRQRPQPDAPELPTILESGVAQLDLESWFGFFAPAKTPPEVLEKLRAELGQGDRRPGCDGGFSQGRRQASEPERRRDPGGWCRATCSAGPG